MILDRDYVAACRRDRGYGVNPWTTHTRFIISHPLLRDETYGAFEEQGAEVRFLPAPVPTPERMTAVLRRLEHAA